jgi:tRNA U34 5-methylaminomethyl-2-thiouridine-forming methyltransferase MnmC
MKRPDRTMLRRAAEIPKRSFFQPDAFASMRDPEYWTRFVHWRPNLLTALENLSLLGHSAQDPDIARDLAWFARNRLPNGAWRTSFWPGKPENPRVERVE